MGKAAANTDVVSFIQVSHEWTNILPEMLQRIDLFLNSLAVYLLILESRYCKSAIYSRQLIMGTMGKISTLNVLLSQKNLNIRKIVHKASPGLLIRF